MLHQALLYRLFFNWNNEKEDEILMEEPEKGAKIRKICWKNLYNYSFLTNADLSLKISNVLFISLDLYKQQHWFIDFSAIPFMTSAVPTVAAMLTNFCFPVTFAFPTLFFTVFVLSVSATTDPSLLHTEHKNTAVREWKKKKRKIGQKSLRTITF